MPSQSPLSQSAAATDRFAPAPEHALLRQTVRQFVEREVEPQALEAERSEKFNLPLFRRAGELGLHGITVPEAYGGAGMDATAAVIVYEELSTSDPGFALSALAHGVLFCHNLFLNADDAQRERLLPRAVRGETIGGVCISEPDGGTDVLGMRTRAVRDGATYRITGRKMWITNGCVNDNELGDCFIVYAKTDVDISTFVVEKGMPGFSLGQRIKDKTGMRSSPTAELVFEDCRVPAANRLGREGESKIHMMRNLEIERLTLAAMSVGMARRALDIMNRYGVQRKAFGQAINEFGQIQRHIAESYAEYMAARSLVYQLAGEMKLDRPGHRADTDAAKLFAATMAKNVCDRSMQVLGGYGYVAESTVERLWRAAKLIEIGGGTLEAHHKNITRDLARDPGALLR
jgi:isovaleryl-CoA dehydrogenase